jgi:hypothetical protein
MAYLVHDSAATSGGATLRESSEHVERLLQMLRREVRVPRRHTRVGSLFEQATTSFYTSAVPKLSFWIVTD